MNEKDFKTLLKLMVILSDEYDNGNMISELKIKTWKMLLKTYSISDISKAVYKLLETRIYKGFPTVAEIIKIIEIGREERPILAWIEVTNTIRKYGVYESVRFSDPIIHNVIDQLGGWNKDLGLKDNKEWEWTEKEFIKLYRALSLFKKMDIEFLKYLPGQLEIENIEKNCTNNTEIIYIECKYMKNLNKIEENKKCIDLLS